MPEAADIAATLPEARPGKPWRALSDITIIDLTTSIAGPYATMLLADLGADVIKVERPNGDDARHWGPPFLDGDALWFLSVNRNKKSLVLDYSDPCGMDVLRNLIDRADVLVTNQPGPVQRKLGLDAATLRSKRPELIHASLTGFGLDGPNADLPGYDIIAEGYSGVMDLTGPPDAEPQKVGTPAADMLAGADAALAVLAALHRRRSTGEGCTIDTSLTESMIRFMSPRIVPYLGSGELPRRTGAKDSVLAIYQTFETADLPITLAVGNDAIWKRLWQALGQPERGDDPTLATNALRRAQRTQVVAEIQAVLRTGTRAQWLQRFAKAKVPAGPIYRLDEVVADPHFQARSLFFNIPRDRHRLPQVGLGIHFDGAAPGYSSPPPRLGEHTELVLSKYLALDRASIVALQTIGIVTGCADASDRTP